MSLRLRPLLGFMRRLFSRHNPHDFNAELESHLAMHVEDNLRAGMAPDEARRRAVIQLVGLQQTREAYRDRQGLPVLVVEVKYDQVTGQRFRHGTGFLRWRPDKDPKQCTFEQLAPELRPSELKELFGT